MKLIFGINFRPHCSHESKSSTINGQQYSVPKMVLKIRKDVSTYNLWKQFKNSQLSVPYFQLHMVMGEKKVTGEYSQRRGLPQDI